MASSAMDLQLGAFGFCRQYIRQQTQTKCVHDLHAPCCVSCVFMFPFKTAVHTLLTNHKTKQSKAKQSKAKQSKAKQSKAKQNKTKQNKTKQNKTKTKKKRIPQLEPQAEIRMAHVVLRCQVYICASDGRFKSHSVCGGG